MASFDRGRSSVGRRLVLTAVGTVGTTLVFGALALISILRSSLERGVTDAALLRGGDVAALVRAGTLPSSLAFPGEERTVIQVLAPDGAVVASTANIVGEASLARGDQSPFTSADLPVGDGQRFRLTVTAVDTANGTFRVVSGESLKRVDDTVRTVGAALAGGVPVLLTVVAALAWRGSRRALRPVGEIRAEVEAITASDLHRRVPEPGGDDEVARLAVTMNAMLERLEAASARQARFVSDASHELRSPLTVLRAVLEIGLTRPRADWPQRVEAALPELDRLDAVVSDLLLLSSADAVVHPRWTRVDVSALVRSEADRSSVAARVPVVVDVAAGVFVDGDAAQLSSAVTNLISNALRHARSQVTVTVATSDNDVIIDVSDDGAGIPADDRERIFERFVRLDEARSADTGGSGLGLSIVRSIVHAHRGHVTVVAGPPGATVRIVLPIMHTRGDM